MGKTNKKRVISRKTLRGKAKKRKVKRGGLFIWSYDDNGQLSEFGFDPHEWSKRNMEWVENKMYITKEEMKDVNDFIIRYNKTIAILKKCITPFLI